MPVKIRLQRHGSKKRPFYFIVAVNSTSPRDGKFIEKLGTYNPMPDPAVVHINRDRATYWLQEGAQPTTTAKRLLSLNGVLLWKHLLRGVKLGLFDVGTAEHKFAQWQNQHKTDLAKRAEHNQQARKNAQLQTNQQVVERAKEKLNQKLAQTAEADAQLRETIVAETQPTTDEPAEQ